MCCPYFSNNNPPLNAVGMVFAVITKSEVELALKPVDFTNWGQGDQS